MVYSWQKDLLTIPKEQILIQLYNAIINSPNEIHVDQRPSDEDAKRAIEYAIKKNNGKVTEFMGESINVDFSGKDFDFSEFERRYGPYVLHDAVTKCQILGIEQNNYLNRLELEASEFGMCGKYVRYFNAKDPIYNGIYFVCGYDRAKVMDRSLDIEEIYKTQYSSGKLKMDVHAEKLTGGSPFAVHQKIVHYCLNASTIRALGNKFDLKSRIDACSSWFIKNITMLCRNINDSRIGMTGQMENKIALGNFFPIQAENELRTQGEGEHDDYTLHTAPERVSIFKKNMVSLEDLVKKTFNLRGCSLVRPKDKYRDTNFVPLEKLAYKAGHMTSVTMPQTLGKRFIEMMTRECPEVMFSQAVGGGKSTFIFDSRYQPKVQLAYLLVNKPELAARKFQIEDLSSQYNDMCTYGIHFNDIDKLFEEADKQGVKLCVNTDIYYFAHSASAKDFEKCNFIYPISVPKSMNSAFNRLTEKLGIDVTSKSDINTEKAHGLITMYATLESEDELKKWLSKHPDICYFQAKPSVTQLTGIGAKTGFGEGKNTHSSIFMVFDAYYKNEIEYIFLKTKFPEYFKYSLDDVRKIGAQDVAEGKARGVGTSSFGACSSDLERIFKTAQHYNIPICINSNKPFYNVINERSGINDLTYTLTFPTSYTREINSMLEQLGQIDRNDRLLSQDDLNKYNHNPGPALGPSAEQIQQQEEYAAKLASEER
jgi:hypothetical protein